MPSVAVCGAQPVLWSGQHTAGHRLSPDGSGCPGHRARPAPGPQPRKESHRRSLSRADKVTFALSRHPVKHTPFGVRTLPRAFAFGFVPQGPVKLGCSHVRLESGERWVQGELGQSVKASWRKGHTGTVPWGAWTSTQPCAWGVRFSSRLWLLSHRDPETTQPGLRPPDLPLLTAASRWPDAGGRRLRADLARGLLQGSGWASPGPGSPGRNPRQPSGCRLCPLLPFTGAQAAERAVLGPPRRGARPARPADTRAGRHACSQASAQPLRLSLRSAGAAG